MKRRADRGFTLLEVMFALAILFAALAVLIRASARNASATQDAKALTVVTGLTRAKMYDLEEELLDKGFQETAETMDGDFSEEGYPKIRWSALIEKVEIPGLTAMQQNAAAAGAQQGLDGGVSPLAGAMGASGGAAGLGAALGLGDMLNGVLEQAIRKVTLTVTWNVGKREEKMAVTCYFTNSAAVDEALTQLNALGSMFGGGGGGDEGGGGGGATGGGGVTGGGARGANPSPPVGGGK